MPKGSKGKAKDKGKAGAKPKKKSPKAADTDQPAPKASVKGDSKGVESARQVCHFRECSKYHQMKVSLLFTFDEDMKCALAEIIQVQVAETTGSEINYRLCHGCHPKYTAAC